MDFGLDDDGGGGGGDMDDLVPVKDYDHHHHHQQHHHQSQQQHHMNPEQVFNQQRVVVAKLSREELEDRYIRLLEENVLIKKHACKQVEKASGNQHNKYV